jgi:hypothetical protein
MIADGKGILCDSPANIKKRTGLFMSILCQKDPQESKYDRYEKSE